MNPADGSEPALRARVRQQEVVADLGQQALETEDLDQLLHDAAAAVAETLECAYATVLELRPSEELLLREGVGYPEEFIGSSRSSTGLDSQAGYTLRSEEPIVVEDYRSDDRFGTPEAVVEFDITSGISVVIGSVEEPFSVLAVHSTEHREFARHDAAFVQSVASVLASAVENERSTTEVEDIYGRISDAFFGLDEEWRFTYLNEQAHELINPEGRQLEGTEIWNEFPAAAERKFKPKYERAMYEQETVAFEEYYPEPLDTWFEVRAYPSETGLSVYFKDITERKAREQALERSNRRLEESNERLEQFAYAASHDMQEPLRMVSSYLQLIDDRYADRLDDDGQEFLAFAVDGADRMREMINGLLDYSRVETRGDPLEPVSLDNVVEDVLVDLSLQIEETDADVRVESLPRVTGDPNQLRQLFQNLLDNALTYAGTEPPTVRVSAERTGDYWEIAVRDEGIGMEPTAADGVFEVFQRLHSHEEYEGTGIGLALCERIVERHGGEIWVDSELDEGSTFTFTLPAADDGEG